MPTSELRPEFRRDYGRLSPAERASFKTAARKFVADLKRGPLRAGLRVKAIQGHTGIYEMTSAPNGRATIEYGSPQRPGEVHVTWRRIGTHAILTQP